ncbi:transposase [Pectinatus frisingensis]|uniref:transposase n=1 Tax=Pectinatus frisingensis TaxID=865 RepID=UPI003D8013EB
MSYMTERRSKRTFIDEFKYQMVELYNSGKSRTEIIKEYDLILSSFDKWVTRINSTGSSKEKNTRTPQELELIKLRKENQKLKMENDILKQAVLILGQK